MSTTRESIQHRLARIEGQVRGLINMIEQERDPVDVLIQVSALRAALDSVGSLVFSNHLEDVAGSSGGFSPQSIKDLKTMMEKFLR